MAETTIEWTRGPNGEQGYTFNPWIGCEKISPACDNCYAAAQDKFRHWTTEGWGGPRKRTSVANWRAPLKWNAEAAAKGVRYRVFCASLADVFDNQVPANWHTDLFSLIRQTPNLDWLLLTKRIGNAHEMMVDTIEHELDMGWDSAFDQVPWPNVWIGATIANQEEADRDIPKLLKVPARVRFLSMEPLLGPVDISEWLTLSYPNCPQGFAQGEGMENGYCGRCAGHATDPIHVAPERKLDWVITGGESGPGARPSHPDWFRSLRDQCQAAGVPFLFKQWGDHKIGEMDAARLVIEWQDGTKQWWRDHEDIKYTGFWHGTSERPYLAVPKRKAGRLLDGRTWDGFPT